MCFPPTKLTHRIPLAACSPDFAAPSWFKKYFFKWTNKPPCSGCGARGACMQPKGGCAPTPEEASSMASVVELYRCKECGAETRYPRYNDPAKLLETRNVSRFLIAASVYRHLCSQLVPCVTRECVAMLRLLRCGRLLFLCLWQQQQQQFGIPCTSLCCVCRDDVLCATRCSVSRTQIMKLDGWCLFNFTQHPFRRCWTTHARRGDAASGQTASLSCAERSDWRRGAQGTGRTTSGPRYAIMTPRLPPQSPHMSFCSPSGVQGHYFFSLFRPARCSSRLCYDFPRLSVGTPALPFTAHGIRGRSRVSPPKDEKRSSLSARQRQCVQLARTIS